MGAVGAVVTLLAPLVVGICAMFATALVVETVEVRSVAADSPLPLLAAGVFTALTAWWGPGGAGLRRGSRSLVRGMTGHPTAHRLLVVVALLAGAVLVAVAVGRGGPAWWPLVQAPGWVDSVVPAI
jgi:hypothetical protein